MKMYETYNPLKNSIGLALRSKNVLFKMDRILKGGSRLRDTQTPASYENLNVIAKFYSLLRTFKKRERSYILWSVVAGLSTLCKCQLM